MMGREVGGFAAAVAFVVAVVAVAVVEVAGLAVAAFAVSAGAAGGAAKLAGRRAAAGQRGAGGCGGCDAGIYLAGKDAEDCTLKGPGCTLAGEFDMGSRKSQCWACRRMGGEGGDRGWSCCCCWTAAFGKFAQDIVVVAVAAEGDKAVKRRSLAGMLDRLAAVLDCARPDSISRPA